MGGQPYLVKIRSSVSKLVLFVSMEIDTHAMMLTSWQPADKRASARALLGDWCTLDCTPSSSHHQGCLVSYNTVPSKLGWQLLVHIFAIGAV
jgi:hypothetical protein